MKREKRLTKKERKALSPGPAYTPPKDGGGGHHHHGHIHCTACGKHLDQSGFDDGSAQWVACEHGSQFASCAAPCLDKTKELLAEHDRTGKPVQQANAWH